MKVTLLKPKVSVVNDKMIIYKLPWKLNFSYDEGKSIARTTMMSTLKTLAVGLHIPLEGVVTGTAKCHSKDKFNYAYGRAIAESKAKAKIYKMAVDVANTLGYYLDNAATCISVDYSKHGIAYAQELDHLEEILKNQESWLRHREEVKQNRKSKKNKR